MIRTSWPLSVLLVGYPLWWALGLGGFTVIALAMPMAVLLWLHRPLRVPKGLGLWLLLILCYLISATMLTSNPPGTYGDAGAGRFIAYGMRLLIYVSLLVVVLYIGNLAAPTIKIVRMLGALFITTVGGGLLGILAPRFEFTAPLEWLLPEGIGGHPFVRNLIHPEAAQIHWVLGHPSPRPEAPFEWANAWGSNFSVLLVWFIVGWLVYGGVPRRVAGAAILLVAVVPAVYSLNRGMWLGIALAVLYLAVRLPRYRLAVAGLVAAVTVLFVASPLAGMVAERLDRPGSSDIRSFTIARTIEAALHSPLIGYGGTRDNHGNYRSITTGKTGWCPDCGHPPLGSDGQLWLLLISQGIAGAGLYVAFFAGAVARYWRGPSPIARAGTLVMLLVLLYMFVYDAFVTPLSLYLISFAVLWRNSHERRPPADAPSAGDDRSALATRRRD